MVKKIKKHTRSIIIRLYITVSNNSAVVGIYMVTCITAQNISIFKCDPWFRSWWRYDTQKSQAFTTLEKWSRSVWHNTLQSALTCMCQLTAVILCSTHQLVSANSQQQSCHWQQHVLPHWCFHLQNAFKLTKCQANQQDDICTEDKVQ